MQDRSGARPWSKTASTGCPLGPAEQAWIESSMRWFVDQFGRDAALGEVALPTSEFYPDDYSGTFRKITELTVKVMNLMSCAVDEIDLDLFDGSAADTDKERTVGHYRVKNGRVVIGLDRTETTDPAFLTAIIAHEISHVRLLYERRLRQAGKNHERLTDLLTVYLRFGVFTTNAALNFTQANRGWTAAPLGDLSERDLHAAGNDGYSRLGYLTEQEFGYALACYCRLRGETEPAWAKYLDPGPRSYLKQGLAYLSSTGPGDEFPTLRSRRGNAWVVKTSRGSVPIRLAQPEKFPTGFYAARIPDGTDPAKSTSPGTVITPRSSTCGPECQTSPCTPRDTHAAQRALEDNPAIVLWVEFATAAHLTGYASPVPGRPVLDALRSMPARLYDCALSHAVDAAVAARASVIARRSDPSALADHLIAVLRGRLHGGNVCTGEEPEWFAAPYLWCLVFEELLRVRRETPDAARHPDSDEWERVYGRPIPGDSVGEQVEHVERWWNRDQRDNAARATVAWGSAHPSAIETAAAARRTDADWAQRLHEAAADLANIDGVLRYYVAAPAQTQ